MSVHASQTVSCTGNRERLLDAVATGRSGGTQLVVALWRQSKHRASRRIDRRDREAIQNIKASQRVGSPPRATEGRQLVTGRIVFALRELSGNSTRWK